MSIKDFVEKVQSKIAPLYYLIFFIVIAGIFFALGRLSAIEERHSPVRILQPASSQQANVISAISGQTDASTSANGSTQSEGNIGTGTAIVIGSKTGKKYYFPWCSTVKRIKPENQVTFASIDLAKQAGYTPGGNCKGLQ